MTKPNEKLTVIVGGKGKTGRRVAERMRSLGAPVRAVSPSTEVPFDWNDEQTWAPALSGAAALYLTYHPDLAIPSAAQHIRQVSRLAVEMGVEKIVLLAGRGEPQVHPAEAAVRESGAAWTILECAFFMQNFTEGVLAPSGDTIAFPAGNVQEPFLDCDDIADVVVAALTGDAHNGQTYELTGPRLMTFGEATQALSGAMNRPLHYRPLTFEQYADGLSEHFAPPVVEFFIELFRFLLDGHNASGTSDVERVLGRPARDFEDFAMRAVKAEQ